MQTKLTKVGYRLEEMAKTNDIELTGTDSDEAAKKLVEKLVQRDNRGFSVKKRPSIVFNDIKIDDLRKLYDSSRNFADVGVMYAESIVVCIEVNSSSLMKDTATKILHGLLQLLRIVKAHKISIPDEKLSLVGFALTKLNEVGVAVKVKMQYNSDYMGFDASLELLTCGEFSVALNEAITSNYALLDICKNCKLRSGYSQHVLSLDKSEMCIHGDNPKQLSAWLGVLFKVTKNNEQFYYKKPITKSFHESLHMVRTVFSDGKISCSYAVKYEEYDYEKKLFGYRKVKYDPLSCVEAFQCLKELLVEVFQACKALCDCKITHGDVRLPNICFDEEYKLILIDFDQSSVGKDLTLDLSVFVEDLIQITGQDWVKADEFLSHFCEGQWRDDLLEKSEISQSKKSIKQVIMERDLVD